MTIGAILGLRPSNPGTLRVVGNVASVPGSGNIIGDCTINSYQDYSARVAPQDGSLSGVSVAVGGWQIGATGEVANNYTWNYAFGLEYPAGVMTPFTFSGSAFPVASPAFTTLKADPMPVVIPANTSYVIHSWGSTASLRPPVATLTISGGAFAATSIQDPGAGLNLTSATALTATVSGAGAGAGGAITPTVSGGVLTGLNLTAGSGYTDGAYTISFANGAFFEMATTIGNANSKNHRGLNLANIAFNATVPQQDFATCQSVIAVYAANRAGLKAIGLIGDSIGAGTGDTRNTQGQIGFAERSWLNHVGWCNLSRGSASAGQYQAQGSGRQSVILGNITSLFCQLVRNDAFGTSPNLSDLLSRLESVWSAYLAAGVPVYQSTCVPSTTSTDGWTTQAGQTTINGTTLAQQFNAEMRSNFAHYGLSGIVDAAAQVETGGSGAPTGKWTTGPSDNTAFTGDGVHPNTTGHQAIIDSGVCTPAVFQ